eukprot:scaffold236389_cov19-Prasinocladus_malaysianus.AAC.1
MVCGRACGWLACERNLEKVCSRMSSLMYCRTVHTTLEAYSYKRKRGRFQAGISGMRAASGISSGDLMDAVRVAACQQKERSHKAGAPDNTHILLYIHTHTKCIRAFGRDEEKTC